MNKITKFFDGFGNIGELEEFTDGGPNVARLMSCGVSSWDGTIDGIRRPSINIPPDTLYDLSLIHI